jgi:hypothetical protein
VLGDEAGGGGFVVDRQGDDRTPAWAKVALARWKARSWALQYGHQAPR